MTNITVLIFYVAMLERYFPNAYNNDFTLPAQPLLAGEITPSQMLTMEAGISFRVPQTKLDDAFIRGMFVTESLPEREINEEEEEARRKINRQIQDEIESAMNEDQTLRSLREKVDILAGTGIFAREGFVKNADEYHSSIATRVGILVTIDIGTILLSQIFEKRMRYTIYTESNTVTIQPADKGAEIYSFVLSGAAKEYCFRPSTFLRIPRFDRGKFHNLILQSLQHLRTLRELADQTFEDLYGGYEDWYNEWLLGEE